MQPKPKSIDDYLAAIPPDKRAALQKLRKNILAAAPKAVETIAYSLPSFRLDGKLLVCFGSAAHHCSLYPMSGRAIEEHQAELKRFDTSKGTIRFQPEKPLPAALVRKIIKARILQNEARKLKRQK